MRFKVELTEEAASDFRSLDGSVKKQVAAQLKKLEQSPQFDQALGNVGGVNLMGYHKIYAARKSVRIIYRIIDDLVIVEVVGIGKRADFEVYADVARRLLQWP